MPFEVESLPVFIYEESASLLFCSVTRGAFAAVVLFFLELRVVGDMSRFFSSSGALLVCDLRLCLDDILVLARIRENGTSSFCT